MSNSLIRYLHLSDFHVGKDGYEQKRLFKEIVSEVARWKRENNFEPHYVFITGDIANNGQKKEYETFRRDFYNSLREALDDSVKIIPVPGNHDVARPSSDALGREALLDAGSKFFDASKEGKTARDQVIHRFSQYKKLMSADVSPDWLAKNDGVAIHEQIIDDVSVGVIGLNTAWLSKGNDDKGNLTPGYRLVAAALEKIEDCQIKIVLGHHPLSWWNEHEEGLIRNLFARNHVIYLHGHMHRSEGRLEEGGSENFLVLQAGAAFQARDDERWVNGFSWGEIDLAKAQVRVSPRYWDLKNNEWPPQMGAISQARRIEGTDWWGYQLPGHTPIVVEPHSAGIAGWQELTAESLNTFAREITSEDARRFFDGAEPEWAWALSPRFPVRIQAQTLLRSVVEFCGSERPQFALLRGPTAEGKSMALRQVVAAAARANTSLRVLWHLDDTVGIDADTFERKLTLGSKWLIASDHGDLIAKDLEKLAQRLKRAGRSDVQIVVAAHDMDWRIIKGDFVSWRSLTHFQEVVLGGLPDADATSIAQAWLDSGIALPEGISQSETVESLAARLMEAARADGISQEGALFGALLTLRHGSDLRDHVRALLQRLDGMPVNGGGTVGEAFRYIAAMHSEGLDFFSRSVLQEAMACDQRTLQTGVLVPLASEAAGSGGAQLRTRHRRIAKVVVEIVQEETGDTDDIFLTLVEAAIRLCRVNGEWLDGISNWEYSLAKHFLKHERSDLAEHIAKKILDMIPNDVHYTVNLAQIMREAGNVPGAIAVLSASPAPTNNRVFWMEWGTASGLLKDEISSAWLRIFSVSDDASSETLSADHAKKALRGLAKAFAELYTQYGRHEFVDARAASTTMGLLVSKDDFILKELGNELESDGIPKPTNMNDAIASLIKGLAVAIECGGSRAQLLERIGDPVRYKFTGLLRCLETAAGD